MPLLIHCPACRRELSVPTDLVGRLVKCPTCQQQFTAPTEDPDAASPPLQPSDTPGAWPAGSPPAAHAPEGDYEHERWDEAYGDRPFPNYEKPGKVQAIALMTLLGGIWACLWSLVLVLASGCVCFFWPGTYYEIVQGILAIIKGAQLLGTNPRGVSPKTTAILQIIAIVNLDMPNCILGILTLVFLEAPEVRRYFRG